MPRAIGLREGWEPLAAPLFPLNYCPRGPPPGHSLLNVAILAGLLHGLLLAALPVAGRWHLCWDREATHTLARLGITGEGLGLSQSSPPKGYPLSPATPNLGQDLPSLAHLENSGVMRVLGGPPLEEGKEKE